MKDKGWLIVPHVPRCVVQQMSESKYGEEGRERRSGEGNEGMCEEGIGWEGSERRGDNRAKVAEAKKEVTKYVKKLCSFYNNQPAIYLHNPNNNLTRFKEFGQLVSNRPYIKSRSFKIVNQAIPTSTAVHPG